MPKANFIHLRNHTVYSLLEGGMTCQNIANMCVDFSMPACAITDTNNLFGGPEFTKTLMDFGVQPIIGTQLNIDFGLKDQHQQPIFHSIILLVQNEIGYGNLLKLLTSAHLDRPETELPNIPFSKLSEHNDGLIAFTGNNGDKGILSYLIAKNDELSALKIAEQFKNIFGKDDRFFIELQRHGLQHEINCEPALLQISAKLNLPVVATNECYFKKRENYYSSRALWCIADATYLDAENGRMESEENYFKSPEEMEQLFADIPSAISNTISIAKRCSYAIPKRKPLLPSISKGIDEKQTLADFSHAGLNKRFTEKNIPRNEHEKYKTQLDFELSVIDKMGFNGYFLIVSDFIGWAKNNDVPVGPGRGSGAGSIVAWALKITDLNPFDWGLLFERFLNPERISMPDFDIDFCQDRRGEVIEYVQKKYGFESVGQIITFGTLQAKAVVRDVGRVMQVPYKEVDRIAKAIPFRIPDDKPKGQKVLEYLTQNDEIFKEVYNSTEEFKELIDTAIELEGMFRHASTHAAGVIIGDRPLVELVPLYKDPKSTIPSAQFDMHWIEDSGLIKYDFLGLTTLSIIKQALGLIEKNHGIKLNIDNIPYTDKKSFDIFSTTRTYGVFQFESQGMRGICKQIKPDCIEDLIAIVSLYRPGPMAQIPTYISRKLGLEKVEYLHPMMENILKETYGIMVYQEQVMQIAQKLAGYTLGGADLLRRAMGKKIKSEMEKQRVIFAQGCKETNNIDDDLANRIFDQMETFASYGFNKSHAACYAWIAYQTAYLKAHYPLEFLTSAMNYAMHDFDKLFEFKEEAKTFGIELSSPDINTSTIKFGTEILPDGKSNVLYGLSALKNAGEQAITDIINERETNGKFKNISDFANRIASTSVNKRTLESLAVSGAFDSLEPNRKKVFDSIELILSTANAKTKDARSNQVSLFGDDDISSAMDLVLKETPDFTRKERLEQEKAIIGFYISDHPLDTKKHITRKLFATPIDELKKLPDGTRAKIIGLTTEYDERIAKSSGNPFGLLTVSDKESSVRIMFAGKSLSSMTGIEKDLLRSEGEIVMITIDVKQPLPSMDGEESRRDPTFFGQAIELVNERSANEFKDVKIKIHSDRAVAELKKTLNGLNNGKSRITLLIEKKKAPDAELISEIGTSSPTTDESNSDSATETSLQNTGADGSQYIKVVLPDTYSLNEKNLTESIAKIDDLEIVF